MPSPPAAPVRRSRAAGTGLALALLLVLAAFALPVLLDWETWSRASRSAHPWAAPPLHGFWEPKLVGPGTAPTLLVALLGWAWFPRFAASASWGRLLAVSYVLALAWMLSLALVDGPEGISRVLDHSSEYLPSAREVDDVPEMLRTYIDRIPYSHPDNWPTQAAGHPPLALLFFVGLVRVGLGGSLAAGLVVTVVGATTVVSVLALVRSLGAERLARDAAPFLVLSPAAVFMAVSADAVFAAVLAAGLALLARAAVSTGRAWLPWSVGAGLVLGSGVLLSYGMGLMGLVALAVLLAARSWRPLPVVVAAALVPVLLMALAGFAWWEAYPVLTERYWEGIAADRPAWYWMWGNLAALAVSAGPLVGAGLAHAARRARRSPDGRPDQRPEARPDTRIVALLVLGAVLAVLVADLSRMSKSEVERIWLPFIPFLTLAVALLPSGWRRWGLALQIVWAVLVQHLLYTSW
ncbi:hypothetical protein I601_2916 [Nocardioides dokdonensis FR1436]|uniref:Glycosyltransferase RgtA/B/C/D-like domain-containing protein n=1 Tax=Nocardioides dokdonensis FR1436 TaxID=1300347 RepID=A0A1A9GNV0_9ACTN|nr:hypothetical protein [Nocardioides dokdonensis]ANH39332.1 hypothetical protein I601_2916 [Nocardioides dokdonensis FR1436]